MAEEVEEVVISLGTMREMCERAFLSGMTFEMVKTQGLITCTPDASFDLWWERTKGHYNQHGRYQSITQEAGKKEDKQ